MLSRIKRWWQAKVDAQQLPNEMVEANDLTDTPQSRTTKGELNLGNERKISRKKNE